MHTLPSVTEAYQNAKLDMRKADLNTAYIVALILMPLGFTIDFLVYREEFEYLGLIRLISVVFLFMAYQAYKYQQSREYLLVFENIWIFIIVVSLCAMIFITGGIASSYYAALNLVIIGSTFLLPLSLRSALFIFFITLLLYVVTIFIHDITHTENTYKQLFNNLYFIVLTGIIGSVASFVNENRRITEFTLRYELDERNKELAELDRIKSNFFANISHELRTPLTLILSPIEDLLRSDQPFDFKVTQLLNSVRNNSYRLLKLVNDLLSIVRLDEQNKEMETRPIDLQPLLRGIVDSMKHLADTQKIDLHVNTDFTPAIIKGNVSALEKIFINLLNNAIKFTPKNGEIIINNKIHDDTVTLTIVDTGIGISEKDLPHIFNRFQQADSSATRKYQGTGLGLALVRELTHSLDGDISVNSEINKGTTFTLTFPLCDEECTLNSTEDLTTNEADQSNPLEALHQRADYSLQLNRPDTDTLEPLDSNDDDNATNGRANLLIIEDEPDLRTYLVNSLSTDYRVFSAADGESGLRLVNKHHPDLVLTDLMLPNIDGLELCKIIKTNENLSLTKVILLTARIDEESKMTALKNGADDFLTKPFSTVELKTRLSNLWKSMQLEKDLEKQNQELSLALKNLKEAESKLLHSEKLNAIGSLAAGLLHEVNNPLNYTITAAQILKRDPTIKQDEDMAEMVEDIIEGMDRIKVIVRDLRTFAYPDEADKQQPFILAEAIRSALRFTASEVGNVTIENNVAEEHVVLGSQNHIVQVFINLITNAIKAVKDKQDGTIVINAKPVSSDQTNDDGKILVTVRDNGVGISEESISRIFEPFFTTRDVGEGLGMGLSICHTIIENHGGSFDVKSELGVSTEFSFDLPCYISAEQADEPGLINT